MQMEEGALLLQVPGRGIAVFGAFLSGTATFFCG